MDKDGEVVFLTDCVNCRACEMACQFHHTGTFGYEQASLRIVRSGDGFGAVMRETPVCDTCEGEGIGNYQCVKYCHRAPDALRAWIERTREVL